MATLSYVVYISISYIVLYFAHEVMVWVNAFEFISCFCSIAIYILYLFKIILYGTVLKQNLIV